MGDEEVRALPGESRPSAAALDFFRWLLAESYIPYELIAWRGRAADGSILDTNPTRANSTP